MPDFPSIIGGTRIAEEGANTSTSKGVGLNTSTNAWAQLVASSLYTAEGVIVTVQSAVNNVTIVEIGVGAAASEQTIIGPFTLTDKRIPSSISFIAPIRIPAGTRIAARANSASSQADGAFVQVQLLGAAFLSGRVLGRGASYGAAAISGSADGTAVDPGATANTKGAYVELEDSTANPIRAMLINFDSQNNGGPADASFLFDIAVGSATSEQIILADIMVNTESLQRQIFPMTIGPIPVNIPAGSRLAARSQGNITDATDRVLGVQILGFD